MQSFGRLSVWFSSLAVSAPAWAESPSFRLLPRMALSAPVLPRAVPFREGMDVPPGYHIESRPRRRRALTGGFMFAATYAIALLVAVDSTRPGTVSSGVWNAVPFAGPLIFASKETCRSGAGNRGGGSSNCDDIYTPAYGIWVAASETVGAAMLASAFIFPQPWLVSDQARSSADRGAIAFVPVANSAGASLMAVGRF